MYVYVHMIYWIVLMLVLMLGKFTLKIHAPYWLFKIACESINILILKTC